MVNRVQVGPVFLLQVGGTRFLFSISLSLGKSRATIQRPISASFRSKISALIIQYTCSKSEARGEGLGCFFDSVTRILHK